MSGETINILDEIRKVDDMIQLHSKRISIYGDLFRIFNAISFICPLLIFLILVSNVVPVLVITGVLTLLTKYIHLRTRTLFWINCGALYEFSQYKENLIKESYARS